MTTGSVSEDNVLSINMPLDVREDFAAELEDFVYLAHLGCIEAAEEVYENVLKQHASHSFPILAEYLEMLLDNKRDADVLASLDNTAKDSFSNTEWLFMKLVRIFSTCRLNPLVMIDQDATCWKEIDFTLDDIANSKNAVESHMLEIILSLNLLLGDAPKGARLVDFFYTPPFHKPRVIAPDRIFREDCMPLASSGRFWEAHKILLFVMSWPSTDLAGMQFFEEFARHLSCHPPSWNRRMVELASTAKYLNMLAEVTSVDSRQKNGSCYAFIQAAITVESLLGIFFDGNTEYRGLHESSMTNAIELWIKNGGGLEIISNSPEVQQVLKTAINSVTILPKGLQKVAEAMDFPTSISLVDPVVESVAVGKLMLQVRKTPHTKSRNGCNECKRRKQKCNEARPKCRHCEKRNVECIYKHPPKSQSSLASSPILSASLSSTLPSLSGSVATAESDDVDMQPVMESENGPESELYKHGAKTP